VHRTEKKCCPGLWVVNIFGKAGDRGFNIVCSLLKEGFREGIRAKDRLAKKAEAPFGFFVGAIQEKKGLLGGE
jgi:hypothetical protein